MTILAPESNNIITYLPHISVSSACQYVPADPTFPLYGALGFCDFNAQWSSGQLYTVAPCGIFCSMEQWTEKGGQNFVKMRLRGDLNPCAKKRCCNGKGKMRYTVTKKPNTLPTTLCRRLVKAAVPWFWWCVLAHVGLYPPPFPVHCSVGPKYTVAHCFTGRQKTTTNKEKTNKNKQTNNAAWSGKVGSDTIYNGEKSRPLAVSPEKDEQTYGPETETPGDDRGQSREENSRSLVCRQTVC